MPYSYKLNKSETKLKKVNEEIEVLSSDDIEKKFEHQRESQPTEYAESNAYESRSAGQSVPVPQHGLTATGILSGMVVKIYYKVLEKLIIKPFLLLQVGAFKACYDKLCSIYLGSYSLQRKLEEISKELDLLRLQLARTKGMSAEVDKRMKAYLDVVSPWLKSVSTQWASLEHSLLELRDQPSVLVKVLELMAAAERLLNDRQLRRSLDAEGLDSVAQGVGAMRQILSQIRQWQILPQDAGFSDYLLILTGNPLIAKQLEPSLIQLAEKLALEYTAKPYPASGSLTEVLGWLAETLTKPELQHSLRSHLEVWLGDRAKAKQLLAAFRLAEQLSRYPTESGLGEQSLWLLSALGQFGTEGQALSWIRQFQSTLGADSETIVLLDRLLTLNRQPNSLVLLIQDLSLAVAPSLGQWVIGRVAGHYLPTHATQALADFYRASSASESWTNMLSRMAQTLAKVVKPYGIQILMGDPLAAATVQYAEALQNHNSWEQTLQWFVAHDQSQDQTLLFAYSQYLNVMVAWQVYQAFNRQDPREIEDSLRRLARQLKDYQVVRHYPQLEKLVDLLPLLPALREANQTVGEQPTTTSWLAWGKQWLDALAGSDNKSLKEAREQLSRHMENWLADAIMLVVDASVQQPWGLLPGAEATGEPTLAASQPATPSLLAPNWQLPVGISLEALSAAAFGYALWRTRSGKPERPPEEIELEEILVHTAPAVSQDETSQFRSSTLTLGATRSVLTEQKAPLLLGIISMVAGGALIYGSLNRRAGQLPDQISDEELRKMHELIAQLDVADLYFIFDQSEIIEEWDTEAAATKIRVRRNVQDVSLSEHIDRVLDIDLPEQDRIIFNAIFLRAYNEIDAEVPAHDKMRDGLRMFRTIRLIGEYIREIRDKPEMETTLINAQHIEMRLHLLSGIDLMLPDKISDILNNMFLSPQVKKEFSTLFDRAKNASDVQVAPPGQDRNIRQLLKTIEMLDDYIRTTKDMPDMANTRQIAESINEKLNRLANLQIDTTSRTVINEFRRNFNVLSVSSTEAAPVEDLPITVQQMEGMIRNQGIQSVMAIERLYDPILNPTIYIDNYIRERISNYNKNREDKVNLNPDSEITVKYNHSSYHPIVISPPTSTSHNFTLKDIVTGQYRYAEKKMEGYIRVNMEHKEFLDSLFTDNLQSHMKEKFKVYSDNTDNSSGLKTYYQNMLTLRCMEYLISTTKIPLYEQAVKDFLEGKTQANEVYFHGVLVNGVFMIPVDHTDGIMMSIDDSRNFPISHRHLLKMTNGEIIALEAIYQRFPQTQDFQDWIINKIPFYQQYKYKGDPNAFINRNSFIPPIGSIYDLRVINVFTFVPSQNITHLANQMYDGLMKRLDSDIDTLIFTSSEQMSEALLEFIKQLLTIISLSMMFIPVTGTLLGQIAMFLATLTIDALYIGATAVQYSMSDRPDLAEAYLNEIIISSVFSGISGAVTGVPMVSKILGATFTRTNLNLAITSYRNLKQASKNMMPFLLKRMNWDRLGTSKKMDFLTNTVIEYPHANELVQLTNRNVVMESIRNSRLLGSNGLQKVTFTWHDLDSELTKVKIGVHSDLLKLRAANNRMTQLLDSPQTVVDVPGSLEKTVRVQNILRQHNLADLLNIHTIESLHEAVNMPAGEQLQQIFRASGDRVLMGTDIARSGFEKALARIRTANLAAEHLPDVLHDAVVLYKPFADGNEETARALYILARKQFRPIITNTKISEYICLFDINVTRRKRGGDLEFCSVNLSIPSSSKLLSGSYEHAKLNKSNDGFISYTSKVSHEAEHVIGMDVLLNKFKLAPNDTSVVRITNLSRGNYSYIENAAPAYHEFKNIHQEHIGTGSVGIDTTAPGGILTFNSASSSKSENSAARILDSGHSSSTYRNMQRTFLEEGDIGSAIAENQKDYANSSLFQLIYRKSSKSEIIGTAFNAKKQKLVHAPESFYQELEFDTWLEHVNKNAKAKELLENAGIEIISIDKVNIHTKIGSNIQTVTYTTPLDIKTYVNQRLDAEIERVNKAYYTQTQLDYLYFIADPKTKPKAMYRFDIDDIDRLNIIRARMAALTGSTNITPTDVINEIVKYDIKFGSALRTVNVNKLMKS
ncbi:hypothetical protein RDT67_19075 [Serratia fonticola]|uniref:Fido domain-containing protein n=1 Tax=Serratia fonticola TaxID=47917 RepID=A0AAJ1YDP3_SERFO|nr:hypothetical protein [Serratia fonticola]MDQ9128523.1 hypothetical protein [Serratia fonticola]